MNRHPARGRRGAAAVEFALWLPILFLLLSGVVDWSWYMSTRVNVSRAVTDGCRTGASVIEPLVSAPGSVAIPRATGRISDILTGVGLNTGGITTTVQFCSIGAGAGCGSPPLEALYCKLDYPFSAFFGLAGTPTNIEAEYLMAMEVQR